MCCWENSKIYNSNPFGSKCSWHEWLICCKVTLTEFWDEFIYRQMINGPQSCPNRHEYTGYWDAHEYNNSFLFLRVTSYCRFLSHSIAQLNTLFMSSLWSRWPPIWMPLICWSKTRLNEVVTLTITRTNKTFRRAIGFYGCLLEIKFPYRLT